MADLFTFAQSVGGDCLSSERKVSRSGDQSGEAGKSLGEIPTANGNRHRTGRGCLTCASAEHIVHSVIVADVAVDHLARL